MANLSWPSLKLKMNAHVTRGMWHGMFKVQLNDKWMISEAKSNKMGKKCWVFTPDDQVHFSLNCRGIFQYELEQILLFNMTRVLQITRGQNE